MNYPITTIVIALVAFVVFLFIGRRVFRLALKLALVGALIVVLLLAAGVGWWRGWFGDTSTNAKRPPAVQTNQRANSNRRSSKP